MFVLIYSNDNTLSTDNDCQVYESAEKAHVVMEGQLERILAEDGYSISKRVECAPGDNDLYGDWADEGDGKLYLGFLNNFDAYLEIGEHKWVIHELPGRFIPQEYAEAIDAYMEELSYAQSTYDLREIALNVCDLLKECAFQGRDCGQRLQRSTCVTY